MLPAADCVVWQVADALVQPTHTYLVGAFVHWALSVSVEPGAGVMLLAVTVQSGAPAAGGGTTEPPVGAQNATGKLGLPSPSGV